MLSKSDVPLSSLIKLLTSFNTEAGYLVPTETGMSKSILDAHSSLRSYLAQTGVHDYSLQEKGTESKVTEEINVITSDKIVTTKLSLYRPETKNGDPRIWIYKLNEFANAYNLLAFIKINERLFLFNASDKKLVKNDGIGNLTLVSDTPLAELLQTKSNYLDEHAEELIGKLKLISNRGFVESLRNGDTGVGMTLETLLGITANSNRAPDYKGIEIKAKRVRGANNRTTNNVSLFSQVPNWPLSTCKNGLAILNKCGYIDSETNRLQLYCTVSNSPNPQSLSLFVNENDNLVECKKIISGTAEPIVVWDLGNLKTQLESKHKQTFWVKAKTKKNENNLECFHYIEVEHTQNPLTANLPSLIEIGAITMDFTLSKKATGNGTRDHGYLFRIKPSNFDLLFPPSKIIKLTTY
ncbi:MvaI/BcnI family restriction endonuclease [Polynucleobacter kasalickyi]|uniref:MvaI/BcnI restriction endonuclease family protein n=1 Tax=Polynucleobacter kasalickyi TaxID=1938817 RepID=A0A1W2CQ81_9BURK|nr:MvaI/BcnI family restriction endonuclease [Polynucleobacter kasalickyi]SMC87417.1 MvaI/BcnI restriction endonuclease family protein [Polynucleobacter kasalickyi]